MQLFYGFVYTQFNFQPFFFQQERFSIKDSPIRNEFEICGLSISSSDGRDIFLIKYRTL